MIHQIPYSITGVVLHFFFFKRDYTILLHRLPRRDNPRDNRMNNQGRNKSKTGAKGEVVLIKKHIDCLQIFH